GELQPGRRLQGHLGAGRRHPAGDGGARAGRPAGGDPAHRAGTGPGPGRWRAGRPATAATAGGPVVGVTAVSPMLSRIAESLFWIGRYVERADVTARILDVHLHLLLEDPWVDEDAACRSLVAVMGMPAPPPAEPASPALQGVPALLGVARVLDQLGFDDA